jgi:hypothetical protein
VDPVTVAVSTICPLPAFSDADVGDTVITSAGTRVNWLFAIRVGFETLVAWT